MGGYKKDVIERQRLLNDTHGLFSEVTKTYYTASLVTTGQP